MSDTKYSVYDPSNIFAKILRGEIPCKKVYEDEFALAFHDIHPQAPVHVLVVPKGDYISFADFSAHAPADLIAGFTRAIGKTAEIAGVAETGYRVLYNAGPNSLQEVPHLHAHILGGRPLGAMLVKP